MTPNGGEHALAVRERHLRFGHASVDTERLDPNADDPRMSRKGPQVLVRALDEQRGRSWGHVESCMIEMPKYINNSMSMMSLSRQNPAVFALCGLASLTAGCSYTLDLEPRSCKHDDQCSINGTYVCVAGACEVAELTEDGTSADDTSSGTTASTSDTTTSGTDEDDSWTSEGTTTGTTGTSDTTSSSTSTSTSSGGSTTCADGCTTTDDTSAVDEDSTTGFEVPPENILTNGGFEDGVLSPLWNMFGTSTVALVQDPVFEGTYAGSVTSRDADWNGIAANITNDVVPGGVYGVAAQLRLDSDTITSIPIRMSWKLACYGETELYTQLRTLPARNDEWRRYDGTITIPENCEASEVSVYFEGGVSGEDFLDYFIDDFWLWVIEEPEQPDPGESSTGSDVDTDTDTDGT